MGRTVESRPTLSFLQHWLQALLVAIVVIVVACVLVQIALPWVNAHLIPIIVVGVIALFGGTAPWTVPTGWRAIKAVSLHKQEKKDREAYRALLTSAKAKLDQGYNLEYVNSRTGDQLKVNNPFIHGHGVSLQEVQTLLDDRLALPLLAASKEHIEKVVHYAEVAARVPFESSLLGVHPDSGELEIVSPDNYKTAWFVGGSNTGKTNTVYGKVADAVRWGAKLIICDNHAHKPDSLANKLGDFHHRLLIPIAQTDQDIKDAILFFLKEFKARRDAGASCDEKWLIVNDEVNATSEHIVKITDAEVKMLLEEYGIRVKDNFVKLRVFFRALGETCGYESRGFEMFGYFISQKAAGLSWLRNAMMTVFVHGLLMDSEALLAANNDRKLADLVKGFKKGRTLVYGYEFEQPMILQQPKYEISEVVNALPSTPFPDRSEGRSSNQTVNTLGTAWEQAQEADGIEDEPQKDVVVFELKKLLGEIGKMKADGKSNAEILKHYELHPAGRNNTNLGTLVEIIEEAGRA